MLGSSANATNGVGRTPTMQAVICTNRELVELLLAQSAMAGTADAQGQTALHFAAARNLVEIGELLRKNGSNPNAMSKSALGPLHLAAACGCAQLADLLLHHGADVNLQPPVKMSVAFGNSPLHWAAHRGHSNVVSQLLAKGADAQAVNLQAQTPADTVSATARGLQMGLTWFDLPHPGRSLLTNDAARAEMLKLLETKSPETKL